MIRNLSSWCRLGRDRKAATAVFVALAFPLMLGASAFVADLGIAYVNIRQLQALADAGAAAAAASPVSGDALVKQLLDANGTPSIESHLEFGSYLPDASLRPEERFTASTLPNAAESADAVDVRLTQKVPRIFAGFLGTSVGEVSAHATASIPKVASLSLGTEVTSLDRNMLEFAGTLLGKTHLTEADFNAVRRARFPLRAFLKGIVEDSGGSLSSNSRVEDIIDRPVAVGRLLILVADILGALGDNMASPVFRKAARIDPLRLITPAKFVVVNDTALQETLGQTTPTLSAQISAANLLQAIIAGGGFGLEQTTTIPLTPFAQADLEVLLGGGAVGAPLAVGTMPITADSNIVRARLHLRTKDAMPLLSGSLDFPIELVVSGGKAVLTGLTCAKNPADREVRVSVTPSIVRLSVGGSVLPLDKVQVTDVPAKVTVLTSMLGFGRINASGGYVLRQLAPTTLVFRGNEIGNGTVKSVATANAIQSLIRGLLDDTVLSVEAGPFSMSLTPFFAPIMTFMYGLAPVVDTFLVNALGQFGIGLGTTSVRVDDIACGHARIVG